jgi:hypothetical protein
MKLSEFLGKNTIKICVGMNNRGGIMVYLTDERGHDVEPFDGYHIYSFAGYGGAFQEALKDYVNKLNKNKSDMLYFWRDKHTIPKPREIIVDMR